MAAVCIRQGFLQLIPAGSSSGSHHDKLSTSVGLGPRPSLGNNDNIVAHGSKLRHRHQQFSSTMMFVPKASRPNGGNITPSSSDEDDEGVSLGTMKLPVNTDLAKFESLLFQWANSLFQGANLPLPVPLKVDKIPGGARLGFITIGDGATEVLVYIDCFVSPATNASPPIFRAIRNGNLRDKVAPGEQRIMKSLLAALQKSVQLAQV